jgi:hypothetical protein
MLHGTRVCIDFDGNATFVFDWASESGASEFLRSGGFILGSEGTIENRPAF